MVWFNPVPDLLILEFSPHPIELPADTTDMAGMRAFIEQMVQLNGGAVVAVEHLRYKTIDIVKSIFKYRQTASTRRSADGTVYASLYIIPFAECHYLLKIQCNEYGTPGMREAIVTAQTTAIASQKLAAPMQTSSYLSDDEQYDSAFPLHPLSRLRSYLRQIEETLKLDEDLCRARPY